MKLRLILFICFMAILAAFSHARAAVVVGKPQQPAMFKVDGKDVDPIDAHSAALKGSENIQRCSAVKNVYTKDGSPAFRCTKVHLEINPNTGADRWVRDAYLDNDGVKAEELADR